MADLDGFEERYPLNSRLVKRDGRLVEEVYRIGGRYGDELSRIVRHLEAAIPLATPSFAAALAALVQWYRTGEDADRTAFDIAWVQGHRHAGGHDERLHRGLHGRPRHQGRVGGPGLLHQRREDLAHPAAGRARAVVRRPDADRARPTASRWCWA